MAKKPRIALVMGSTSDMPQVEPALEILKDLKIPYTTRVLSAHRTPDAVRVFAKSAHQEGIQVIIACAGAAAHLAGVIASHTDLPVIGVPMAGTTLGGLDALFSTVQMPGGVPVATMGIGKAGTKNAVLMAARILALQDAELEGRLARKRENQAARVLELDQEIRASGTWTWEG